MDLESAAAQLYAGSPDDFIERRKALVAQARTTKDRPLATAIGKLRRPTRSAWLVNLYAREAPEELAALLELGAALQAAQERMSAPDLRRLSGERSTTLAAATRRAVELGRAHDYAATEAVRQEVTQTLQAALADPEVAEQTRAGTVTEAHSYGGFGGFGGVGFGGVGPESAAEPAEAAEAAAEPAESVVKSDEQPADDTAERRAVAEEQLQLAEEALSRAGDEAEQSTRRADELADRVESLRAELAEAERGASEASAEARTARKQVSELEQAVKAAREAYEAI